MASIYSYENIIMDSMSSVYRILKKNSFSAPKTVEFEICLKRVEKFFNLDATEAALFTYIFVNYFDFNEKPVCFGVLAADAGVNSLRFLQFRDEIKSLEEKGYIREMAIDEPNIHAKCYGISDGVLEAVIKQDEKLLAEGLRTKDRDLIYPENIKEKKLFYSDSVKYDVDSLESYLAPDSFSAIQTRLAEKSLPKGVCILMQGEPGTGKTESVYQIAKTTGRPVYHVDTAYVISTWVGGTERNIASLFEKYEAMCAKAKAREEPLPILLFNEADALFAKRIENPRQGSEVSSNHIQAVLLDLIERQTGIVMLTTNFAVNFDKAFERRFLYKIKFEKPDLEIKKKIWKDKLSWLNGKSVEHLASSYSLSGAEIDNVVRKATMNEVLTGKRSSVSEIEGYCQKEKMESLKNARIGFSV